MAFDVMSGSQPPRKQPRARQAVDRLARIERGIEELKMVISAMQASLDVLVTALADEEENEPRFDLDGNELPGERDQTESLG